MSEQKQVPSRCEFEVERLILKIDDVLASDIAVIDNAIDRIISLIEKKGCTGDDLDRIDPALREALANSITHGNRSSPEKYVRLCVAVQEDRGILIVIKDVGSGFDPVQIPSPVVGQNLLAEHGRGIFLINQFMDDVRFNFGNGTAIYMRRNPPPKTA